MNSHPLDDLAERLAATVPATVTSADYVAQEAALLDEGTRAALTARVDRLRTTSARRRHPAHPPLLGLGAALTDAAPLLARQLMALARAAVAMDLSQEREVQARAAVRAYLDSMRAGDPLEDETVVSIPREGLEDIARAARVLREYADLRGTGDAGYTTEGWLVSIRALAARLDVLQAAHLPSEEETRP